MTGCLFIYVFKNESAEFQNFHILDKKLFLNLVVEKQHTLYVGYVKQIKYSGHF